VGSTPGVAEERGAGREEVARGRKATS